MGWELRIAKRRSATSWINATVKNQLRSSTSTDTRDRVEGWPKPKAHSALAEVAQNKDF